MVHSLVTFIDGDININWCPRKSIGTINNFCLHVFTYRFGRRKTFLVCFLFTIVFGVALSFSSSVLMYMLLRFFLSGFIRGIGLVACVIGKAL